MNKSLYLASSPGFVVLAVILYISMGLALWISNIPWWLCMFGSIFLLLDLRRVISLHGLRKHKNSVFILCQDCDKWQYQLKSGRTYKGSLIKARSFCSKLVIILYMQHLSGGRYIVIPRDCLSDHNYRLLAFKLNC